VTWKLTTLATRDTMPEYYISVTGLKVRSPWLLPTFFYHAIPSSIQAKSAPGNIDVQTTNVDGIHHTLSVWENKKSMVTYLRQGAHLKAMKTFGQVAAFGKTHGYESDKIPTWPEAIQILETHGKLLRGKAPPQSSNSVKTLTVAAVTLSAIAFAALYFQDYTVGFRPLDAGTIK